MKKDIFAVLILAISFLAIIYLLKTEVFKNTSLSTSQAKKLQVITTLYPLYDFAKTIGQDKVDVTLLLPPGVEAHSFEPKPNDVIRINQADVFIYTGKFMEVWVEDVIRGITNKNLIVVNASDSIVLTPGVSHDVNKPVGIWDPHIWLDFGNAQTMVNSIAKAFEEKDPVNRSFYDKNAKDYDQQIALLDREYRSVLSSCRTKEIIYGGHYAFGYLANRYGLKYLAAQGVSPDAEPTANDLVALVNQIKKDNVRYIFYEELESPKIAETLRNETQAKLLVLNAVHNISKEQFMQGITYLSLMKSNLANLKIGLECQ